MFKAPQLLPSLHSWSCLRPAEEPLAPVCFPSHSFPEEPWEGSRIWVPSQLMLVRGTLDWGRAHEVSPLARWAHRQAGCGHSHSPAPSLFRVCCSSQWWPQLSIRKYEIQKEQTRTLRKNLNGIIMHCKQHFKKQTGLRDILPSNVSKAAVCINLFLYIKIFLGGIS